MDHNYYDRFSCGMYVVNHILPRIALILLINAYNLPGILVFNFQGIKEHQAQQGTFHAFHLIHG